MQFQKTLALTNGLNSLKTLLVAAGYTGPMWADELSWRMPGATWAVPNTLDVSVGNGSMAALDDGERFAPGGGDKKSPGTGKIDLTRVYFYATDANQRVHVKINHQ